MLKINNTEKVMTPKVKMKSKALFLYESCFRIRLNKK